jgi:uncharacterized protein
LIMSWEHIVLVLITGVVCGVINTLSGSGSLISLPVLMFIGLPPHVANGTNRIGVFFQNLVSTANFKHQKVLETKTGWEVAIPSILGSVLGAFIVLELNQRAVEITVGIVLLIMLIPMWYKPNQWLNGLDREQHKINPVMRFGIFFLIGAYGGFIQAGVGIFLLSALVLSLGFDLVRANALKGFINLIFMPFALAVFIYKGQIDIVVGLILAVGNSIGAYFASKYAVSWGAEFVRWVLLVVIIGAGTKLLFFP